jgi:RNA 3'-terminal phosphate cyclase (ATP)
MSEPRIDMIDIDGSQGEGGGQILRTALALSLCTGRPLHMARIRAGRAKPGLLRQHLTAVNAAAEVGGAEVTGAALGSRELTFVPGAVRGGEYHFAVGTAGSATLVLQTVLPALCLAREPSRLALEGGTHNPLAPPWDFLAHAFLPLLGRMGPVVTTELERFGFYPAGGGRFTVAVTPVAKLRPLTLLERGTIRRRQARAVVANLPTRIAQRELGTLQVQFGLRRDECRAQGIRDSAGPGNVVMIEVEAEHVTEVFTGFGEKGVKSEEVAGAVGAEMQRYLATAAPVGEHLADQLLLPLALAGGGTFRTLEPSSHTRTNLDVIRRFLDVEARVEVSDDGTYTIELRGQP